jgi:hypothetical protein
MPDEERERTGPTEEVGSEGGSPGEIELDKIHSHLKGTEATSTVVAEDTEIVERDRNLTRDDRPRP